MRAARRERELLLEQRRVQRFAHRLAGKVGESKLVSLPAVSQLDPADTTAKGALDMAIDGYVYLGTALQALVVARQLPKDGTPEAAMPAEWSAWPLLLLPAALVGLLLALRIWNARPAKAGGGH